MIVNIFSVLRKSTQSFDPPRKQMYNVSRLSGASRVSDNVTQLLYNGTNLATPKQGIQVSGNVETIQASIAGSTDPNAVYNFTPDKINDVANTAQVSVRTGDILYGIEDGGNVLLFVINGLNALVKFKYQINSTDLEAQMVFLNNISDNIDFTGTFGACSNNTQAFTYNVNQAVTLNLQVQTGDAWHSINTNVISVAAGTAAITFQFQTADVVLNDAIRVIATKSDGTIIPIVSQLFTCTGGSASGSGTQGDCTEYAYFDSVWDDTDKELGVGATCTTGYNIQVASNSDFATDKIVFDIETVSTILSLPEITAGTWYARVRNASGTTDWSAVYTFVAT